MGTNVGNQIVSILYHSSAQSLIFNQRQLGINQTGIFSGGWLSVVTTSTASISPFVAEITDGNYQVRVETQDAITISVSVATPYIVIRWAYTGSSVNDYASVVAVATPLTNDLVIGLCTFSGASLIGFNYDSDYPRSEPDLQTLFLKVEPTGDSDLRVRVRGGRVQTAGSTASVPPQVSDLFTPPTTNSKKYLVYVNRSTGAVSIDSSGTESATPTAPSYGGKLVIAEVTLASTDTAITSDKIRDTRPFVTQTSVFSSVKNVLDYGAVGDGYTDCSAAFLAAHDAAWADGGGVVYIPHGLYRVEITIDDNASWSNSPRVTWKGEGCFASRLMAITPGAFAITVTGNSAWDWVWAFEDIGFAGGYFSGETARSFGGVLFSDPTPGVSSVQFLRCAFDFCTYGYKSVGPLYYSFNFCTFCRNDFGVHITRTAGMQGGCQYFTDCNFYINYIAAVYAKGNIENLVFRGGVNEGNGGFSFFFEDLADTFATVVENIYTENNGTLSTVTVDGTVYSVNDTGMHFKDCSRIEFRHVKMNHEPEIDNSTLIHYDAYLFGSPTSPITPVLSNGGRCILRQPYLDLRTTVPKTLEIETPIDVLEATTRWAAFSTARKKMFRYDKTNLLTGGSMATLSSVANAYGKTYSFVQGDAPYFGRYLSVTLPQTPTYAGSFRLFDNIPTTADLWYVASWDARCLTNDARFYFQWITSLGATIVECFGDRWLHYRFIQKAPSTQSTADLYMWNPDVTTQTFHIANMQLVGGFATKEEALDFLNSGSYAIPGSGAEYFAGATNPLASHDYGAGSAAWTMTTAEACADLITVTNASGSADAVFPVAVPGRSFTVYNNSGQTITFKVTGQTGFSVATGKYAIGIFNSTDCVEIYEQ